ncbi:MAG: hypothetical protein JSV82_08190 [Planctomycetota bacterium]|nr:MAG: hypothetical protein JSV82_08190 [Planctomycetota bacterium]
MNGRGEQEFRELFEKFLDSKEAEQAIEDIRKGEQILIEHPAPEPDEQVVGNIKAEIAKAILRKKATAFRRRAYKAVAIAAAVILLIAVGVKLFEKGNGEPVRIVATSIIPKVVWESGHLADEDADLATLTAEVEEIESEILAVKFGENGGNGFTDLTELEVELEEINSSFWEG